MAKSQAIKKSEPKKEAKKDAPLTTKVANGSPYQLDPAQVERAATALVSHMKKHAQEKEEKAEKRNLALDEDEPEQKDHDIYLSISTKTHISDQSRLKPGKVALPHAIRSGDVKICLITVDPQRAYKDLIESPAFPEELRAKIGRVIGLDKLKKKYKTFETKRQILAEYDIFMADDRVISVLPGILGKTFYKGTNKRPIPVRLTAGAHIEKQEKSLKKVETPSIVGTPEAVAKEIEGALSSTLINLSPSANTVIKVAKASMTPQQTKENVEAVVSALTTKYVPQGWRNIRGIHIKGPQTLALPIWLADELWTSEDKVLEEPWKPAVKEGETKSGKVKRKWDEWENELMDDDELVERRAEMKKAKRNKKRKAVKSISRERRSKLKKEALESVKTPLIAG
ncbi:ribosomal protein L1 [Amniculicola lignicola CBS 123094]|uniref:Ribosomal protein L1 n=1 Tax=Amniculicola lignicola CBS 123094 TaxID=1392246 RepID=A0A6A5W7B2_9PLEO|nr:ribosomal protein L1 [Amniculicola lignicola CBS 123094]